MILVFLKLLMVSDLKKKLPSLLLHVNQDLLELGHLAEHTIQAVSSPELDDDEKERNPP